MNNAGKTIVMEMDNSKGMREEGASKLDFN